MPELVLDVLLAAMVLGVALRALHAPDLVAGVVHYIVFGLLLAIAWVRLDAPDIALAEAAIGAGLTGALLLDAVGTMRPADTPETPDPRAVRTVTVAAVVLLPLMLWLVHAVLVLPDGPGGLTAAVGAELATHPVSHPVTAVLLDFRAYDTWLEVMVLLLAITAALVVRRTRDLSDAGVSPPGSMLLYWGVRFALPVMIVVSGYLLWRGTQAPGGAFQSGAVLAAAGVLAVHAGALSPALLVRPRLGWLLAAGGLAFLAAAVVPLVTRGTLLHIDDGLVILAVESFVAVSIATTLMALFVAARPATGPRAEGPL